MPTIAIAIAIALAVGLAMHWPAGAAKRTTPASGASIEAYLPVHPYARSLADWLPTGH